MSKAVLSARRPWKEEFVFHDGDEFFKELLQAVEGARLSIDLETYIFDRDSLGRTVLDALRAAAGRGVSVRLLLDGLGCAQWGYADLQALRKAGLRVRCFHPLPWQRRPLQWLSSMRLRKLLIGIWKLNRRNHRKTCIVDRELAFVGGMNVSSRHSRAHSGSVAWRDTSVRVKGVDIQPLISAFNHAWAHSAGFLVRRAFLSSSKGVRLNVTSKQRKAGYEELLERMAEAKKRIWFTNPYFTPDLSLIRTLRFAAWAGVDVRLLLSKRLDVWGIQWAAKAFYQVLLLSGVRIYEYAPALLHAKTALIDDWAMVGSSNLNHRSLLHDLEADLVLRKSGSLSSLEGQFMEDLRVSKEIDPGSWRRRGLFERLFESIALIFKRWI